MVIIMPIKLFLLLFIWLIGLLIPIIANLWSDWINIPDNSHGILVPFISIYFVLTKRRELQNDQISTNFQGGLLLAASLLLYIIAFAGDIAFITRLMLITSLWGIVLYNYGSKIFKIFIFPLLFLLFMVPAPISAIQSISLPLQLFATDIATKIIMMFSIPVYQEGNMLYFANNSQLEVAQACSGIRSIISLLMLSVILAHISGTNNILPKTILLLSALPVALLVNIIRVSSTGILAHYYGSIVARDFLHELSGIAVFIVGFIILLLEFSAIKLLHTKYSTYETKK